MCFSLKRNRDDEEDGDELPQPPSWEALSLLGPYMEPKSLAVASCVSSSLSQCFSSEHLWKFKQNAFEPFNFAAAKETKENISYKRLVSTVESAVKRRRKNQPKISLSDLVFTVYVSTGSKEATIVRKGEDMVFNSNERFEIEADVSKSEIVVTDTKELRVVWQVMYKDYEKIFTILDSTRSSSSIDSGWFTKELPTPENSYLDGSNLVGDVKPCFDGDDLCKVRLGVVNSSTWSSLFLDDVLRYLQCFLL